MFDLQIDDGVAWLRIGRPEARNAIPLQGWDRLAEAVLQAAEASVLILAGEPGGTFCAGADISDFERLQAEPEARTEFREAIRGGLGALRASPVPSIALVEGACYGAGVALAMACDIRVASPAASFSITPAKLGISYPQEDVHRLLSLVGPGQAARLLYGAEAIDGAEATRIGLAEIVAGEAEAAARALAGAIAANEPASIATLKRGIQLAAEGCVQDEGQDRAFEDLFGSEAVERRLAGYRRRAR
jgi:enoyl-CoA hydratase/carnithine racemase